MITRRITITFLAISLTIFLITSCRRSEANVPQDTNAVDTISLDYSQDSVSHDTKGFKLTEYDTPPVPIQNPMPQYPAKYKRSGIQGVVVLDVEVLSNGTVGDVKVMKSLLAGESGLDEAAVMTIKTWMFKPAMQNKKPVDTRVNIPVPFTLK